MSVCDTLRCEVARDLMPNYIEGLTGKETNDLMARHLQECEACRELCEKLKADMAVPKFEKRDLLRLLKAIRKAKLTQILLALLAGVVATWLVLFIMTSGFSPVSPEEILLQNVYQMPDGSVVLAYTVPGLDNGMLAGSSGRRYGNGDYTFEIRTTFWNRLFGRVRPQREIFYEWIYAANTMALTDTFSVQPMIVSYGYGKNSRELWRLGDPVEQAPDTLEIYLQSGIQRSQSYETFLKDYIWRKSFTEPASSEGPAEPMQ